MEDGLSKLAQKTLCNMYSIFSREKQQLMQDWRPSHGSLHGRRAIICVSLNPPVQEVQHEPFE